MERVGIYNRCSTEEESQRNALAAQAMESREIAQRKGWAIAEQYIESETGTVVYKRSEYQRLLRDMEKDRFDIVMIKSIDRLMRSAKDWYFFLSRLTENQLKLYIYIEEKYYTPDDNLISGIKAILAEDFSRELSKKIKNAHRRRQEKKSGLNITCEMFGWNKIKKNLYEVNEEEAAYYRTAFELAEEGKGFYSISNIMYELGARTRRGQKISEVQWRNMLYTPRAHGTMVLNTRSYNFDTKKYEEVPENNWIYMENALPPIVSGEYQEKVLTILRTRTTGHKDNDKRKMYHAGKYQLSHKLVCAECGSYYYRAGGKAASKEGAVWKCSTFLKNGRRKGGANPKGCDNPNIRENQVLYILNKKPGEKLNKEFQGYTGKSAAGEKRLLEELMKIIEKALTSGDSEQELKRLIKEQKRLTARKDLLVEKLLAEVVTDQEFQKYKAELDEKIETLNVKIESIKQKNLKYNSYECRLKEVREIIEKENFIQKAQAKQLLGNIDHILVYGDGSLKLEWKGEGRTVL